MSGDTFTAILDYVIIPCLVAPLTVWLTRAVTKSIQDAFNERVDSRLAVVEHEMKTNGGVKTDAKTGKIEGSLKDLNVQQIVDLGQILTNMRIVKETLEANSEDKKSMADSITSLARSVEKQAQILEEHTEILKRLTGTTEETKDHLDRKTLHESRQKLQVKILEGEKGGVTAEVSNGLQGTKLVREIEAERKTNNT